MPRPFAVRDRPLAVGASVRQVSLTFSDVRLKLSVAPAAPPGAGEKLRHIRDRNLRARDARDRALPGSPRSRLLCRNDLRVSRARAPDVRSRRRPSCAPQHARGSGNGVCQVQRIRDGPEWGAHRAQNRWEWPRRVPPPRPEAADAVSSGPLLPKQLLDSPRGDQNLARNPAVKEMPRLIYSR